MRIIMYPDPILTMLCQQVEEKELKEMKTLSVKMTEVMLQLNAAGIAANQVGVSKRLAILNPKVDPYYADKPNPIVIINPEIIETKTPIKDGEGCLSLPKFFEQIDRFAEVTIKYRTLEWEEKTETFGGTIMARCVQHEIDHMNGVLQVQKVSPMKKQMWLKAARKRGYID